MTITREGTKAGADAVTEAMVEAGAAEILGGSNFDHDERREMACAVHTAMLAVAPPPAEAFQLRVKPWLLACFGETIAGDRGERNHRFLEEALELVQSTGCSKSEAYQLVDYVFGRDVGEPQQEVGGVVVTLAALCLANGMNMHAAGEVELARIWTKVEAIRAKQAAKPKHSPLPGNAPALSWREKAAQLRATLGREATLDEYLALAATHTMSKSEIEEQQASFVRGMTTGCEHGVLDFETCPDCLIAVRERKAG